MRRYVKPNTPIESEVSAVEEPSGAFDIVKELELCEEILRREVRNLLSESARGKLSKDAAASLRDYIKLLNDMQEDQKEKLKEKSTEELKKLVE